MFTDSIDRVYQYGGDTKTHPSIVDQSVMFVLEPLKRTTDYEYELKRCHETDVVGGKYSHCATLPKLPAHATVCKANQMSPSYWPSKQGSGGVAAQSRTVHRDACELGLGTMPRQPKSILKNQLQQPQPQPVTNVAEHTSKCSDDCNRIRV